MRKANSLKAAVRGLACTLAVTTTMLCCGSRDGWSMLAPSATAGREAPAVNQRAADLQTIRKTLESEAVKGRLKTLGLSDAEIQSRLDKLSDQEVRQLAGQLETLNPGGDSGIGFVSALLVITVLVLLIVYLVKRV